MQRSHLGEDGAMDMSLALQAPLTGDRPRVDRERGCLVGSRCTGCESAAWPARSVCHRCGSPAVKSEAFCSTGSLVTYTQVWVPRPGLETPYTLGQVHLDGQGPVIFGHVRTMDPRTRVPRPVRLSLADDPGDVPWYWFEPRVSTGP